jgi:hypothetical protein
VKPRRRNRAGFALLAVVVVVAAAVLVTTGALFASRAATVHAAASASEARLRHAALDGVALMADRLAQSRAAILAGATPDAESLGLSDSLVFSTGEGAELVEVRLAPMPGGGYLESEGAKLDFTRAGDDAIAALLEDGSSERRALLEAARASRLRSSLDGAASLVSSGERLRALRELLGGLRTVGAAFAEDAPEEPEAERPLIALVTVHAHESLVSADGSPRIDLVSLLGEGAAAAAGADSSVSSPAALDSSPAALDEFSDAERAVFRSVVRQSRGAADDARLAKALAGRGVPPERIAAVLDRVTTHEGALAPARLDVARAPRAVLAAFPGLGSEAAARIDDVRESLDEDERATTAWLVDRRVLSPERYAEIVAELSPRSTAWRFRVEASNMALGAGGDADDDSSTSATSAVPGVGRRFAAFDCIVDVGAEEPRIVFLRDVSLLETARILARADSQASGASQPIESRAENEPRGDVRDERLEEAREPLRAAASTNSRQTRQSRVAEPQQAATMAPPPARRARTTPTGRDVRVGGGS